MNKFSLRKGLLLLSLPILAISCKKKEAEPTTDFVKLQNHSKTPHFLKTKPGFENLEIYSLLSSEDQLPESPEFVYGSMADGCGLLKNTDGTYTLINNIEAD